MRNECLGDGGIDTVLGVNCSVPLTRRGHDKNEELGMRSEELTAMKNRVSLKTSSSSRVILREVAESMNYRR